MDLFFGVSVVWAVSMVHSRAFSLGGVEYVMVPFMDAINHHHDNNVKCHLSPQVRVRVLNSGCVGV